MSALFKFQWLSCIKIHELGVIQRLTVCPRITVRFKGDSKQAWGEHWSLTCRMPVIKRQLAELQRFIHFRQSPRNTHTEFGFLFNVIKYTATKWKCADVSCSLEVTTIQTNGPLARYVKLWVAHAPGMPGTFSPPADFKGSRWLAIPACITARALRTCRDACRDCLPAVAGKTFPAFPAHAPPQFYVSGKRPMGRYFQNRCLYWSLCLSWS